MERKITVDFSVKTVLVVVFSFILLWFLYFLKDIIVLFFVAFVLATALEPVVDAFGKLKMPRWMGIVLLYILILLLMFTLVRLIVPPMTEQTKHLLDNRDYIAERLNSYLGSVPEGIKNTIYDFTNSLPSRIAKYSTSNEVLSNALGIFSGLLGLVTIFVITFYLLLEKNTMENFIGAIWPQKSRQRAIVIFKRIVNKVSLWARGQLILSGAIGLLTYIGLSLLGIDYALTLALIAALTELLPVVGPFIGGVPAVIIAFSVSPLTALWVIILYLLVQQFEAHVLVPQVMKRAVGLSPVAIIFAILVGGKLLGILGVIIAVPVASSIGVLLNATNKKEA